MKHFGWEIVNPRKQDNGTRLKAIVPKNEEMGALAYGSFSSLYSNEVFNYKDDNELINNYREISLLPEVDMAVDEIVNEMIITSENRPVVSLILDDFPASGIFKDQVHDEFKHILSLLDFQNLAYDYARRWYIDSRLAFHIMIDTEYPKLGILDIRQLDPCTIRKVTHVEKMLDPNNIAIIKDVKEYYLYNENGKFIPGYGAFQTSTTSNTNIQISADAIAYASSGIIDPKTGMTLSNLHKVLKLVNQLSMIESALIIYRLSRAPERRVFYVDTGDLPRAKAEEYLKEQIARHRNKMVYDPSTGDLVNKKNVLSMMEDYWLPRRGGTRATEIQTLPGGTNLSSMEDVQYFKEKLYHALNVPLSRLQPDAVTGFSKDSVIVREELKFARFIDKLRKKFSVFLYDLLRKQLILKCIISPNDWNKIKDFIYIDFQRDSYFSEIKDVELMSDRLEILNSANSYVGTFFSKEYIWKKILGMNEEEIEQEKLRLYQEKEEETNPSAPPEDYGATTSSFELGNTESSSNLEIETPVTAEPETETPEVETPKG